MNVTIIAQECDKVIAFLNKELGAIRTGRASPALVEHLVVDYYGTPTPLQQLGTISTPEPRQLLIEAWDVNAIQGIEKAILQSNVGLTPTVDGNRIRLIMPALTEERRQEFVKHAKQRAEQARVSIRTLREEQMHEIKRAEKDGELSQDVSAVQQKELQKAVDRSIETVDELTQKKIDDIMHI
ncbi:MAG: ribosome recycling factor [Candidatus Kerfeldbacteria bacterium]|nr:ribosome recycling factor [Candidatus Kerfeldbacteria bacterium]